jgi:ABC-2 type transport system ATP-binding protein
VIDHGKVIAEGTSRELKASVGGNTLHCHLADPDQREAARLAVDGVLPDSILPQTDLTAFTVKVPDSAAAVDVLHALKRADIRVREFSIGSPSLDDVFFALTGHAAERIETKEKKGAAS